MSIPNLIRDNSEVPHNMLLDFYQDFIEQLKQSLAQDEKKESKTKKEKKKQTNPQVVNRTRWTFKEDTLLYALVQEYGPKHWTKIAEHIPRRTGKQCRERWLVRLNPENIQYPWTKEEDELLKSLHKDLGNKWSTIGKEMPGRSTMQIKNRWKFLLHHDPSLKQEEMKKTVTDAQHSAIQRAHSSPQIESPVFENVFDVFCDGGLDVTADSSIHCLL